MLHLLHSCIPMLDVSLPSFLPQWVIIGTNVLNKIEIIDRHNHFLFSLLRIVSSMATGVSSPVFRRVLKNGTRCRQNDYRAFTYVESYYR